MIHWVRRNLGFLKPDDEQPLQVRLFRILTGITAVLSLASLIPSNILENTEWQMNVLTLCMGALGTTCYLRSLRGRHHFYVFLAVLVAIVDVVWFMDSGSLGSVSFCFFPIILYPIVTFRGRARWVGSVLLLLDFAGVMIVDYCYPALDWPYGTVKEGFIDHLVSGIACIGGLALMIRLVVYAYEADQEKISLFAKQLAGKDENFRAIFESTHAGIFVYSEELRLIDVNKGACLMLNCDKATLMGKPPGSEGSGLTPADQGTLRERMAKAFHENIDAFRWRYSRGSGEIFWTDVHLNTAEVSGSRILVVSVRDISARVAAEEALRQNEERLRMALGASNQGWFDINVETGEGTASGEYAKILGLPPVDFKVSKQNWMEGIHPEDRDLMLKEFSACVAGGGPRVMEYRRRSVEGEWKWIRSVGKIVEWDRSGRPVRMIGTHADVTERKRLESQLLHSQRLDSVGTLAGGVAHDLNNILTPMLMAGPSIRDKLTDPEDQALMAQMEAGARRGAAIVKQLLTFSRDMAETRVSVDTLQVLREMKSIMQAIFPRNINVITSFDGDLWPVKADPVQFHQVLMNLCINARDAMPDGGKLTISARNEEAAGPDGVRAVVILVSDTGQGIDPTNIGRIFDPFFTTKEIGKGTGLGLSVVHGILKNHGGSISVESALGKGSAFRVVLPVSETAPATTAPLRAEESVANRRPAVAVVDDEPLVLRVTVRALERQGYEVISAQRGEDAIKMINERSSPVDLILTDIMMPEMDGPTMVSLLRRTHPTLRVIGVSGLNLEHRESELSAIGFAEVLRKPYDLADLLGAVRRHLPASLKKPGAAPQPAVN